MTTRLTAVATQFEPRRGDTAVATPSCCGCCCCCCCLMATSAMAVLAPLQMADIARQRQLEGMPAPRGPSTLIAALAVPVAAVALWLLLQSDPAMDILDLRLAAVPLLIMLISYGAAVFLLHMDSRAVGLAIATALGGAGFFVAEGFGGLALYVTLGSGGLWLYFGIVITVLLLVGVKISDRKNHATKPHPPGWPYTGSPPPPPPMQLP